MYTRAHKKHKKKEKKENSQHMFSQGDAQRQHNEKKNELQHSKAVPRLTFPNNILPCIVWRAAAAELESANSMKQYGSLLGWNKKKKKHKKSNWIVLLQVYTGGVNRTYYWSH